MIDGQFRTSLPRLRPRKLPNESQSSHSCTLHILVYNLGRNSVGINQSISRKGLNEIPRSMEPN